MLSNPQSHGRLSKILILPYAGACIPAGKPFIIVNRRRCAQWRAYARVVRRVARRAVIFEARELCTHTRVPSRSRTHNALVHCILTHIYARVHLCENVYTSRYIYIGRVHTYAISWSRGATTFDVLYIVSRWASLGRANFYMYYPQTRVYRIQTVYIYRSKCDISVDFGERRFSFERARVGRLPGFPRGPTYTPLIYTARPARYIMRAARKYFTPARGSRA